MDISRPKQIKSQSSDYGLAKKNVKEKNSRSNGALPPLMLKKRGVYVESKSLKKSVDYPVLNQKEKITSLLNPNQKHFIPSALTFQSKPTTSVHNKVNTDNTNKKKVLKYHLYDKTINGKETNKNSKKQKYKFKSKALINKVGNDVKFEILQPRKELNQTPSVYSDSSKIDDDFDNFKWSDYLPRLVQPNEDEIKLEKERKLSHLVREVTEGRMINDGNAKVDEPATLVSEDKNNAGLFNFFVDLLETTFSVYNVKAEYDAPLSPYSESAISSQCALEMNESVAKKLNIDFDSHNNSSPNPSKHLQKRNLQYWNDDQIKKDSNTGASTSKSQGYSQNSSPKNVKKKKVKSESFTFAKQSLNSNQRTMNPSRKTFSKNSNKKYLLNLLKEQLKLDIRSYEEPKNLYEALKIMAKTKQKSKKNTSFDKTMKINCENRCMFRGLKVISPTHSKPIVCEGVRKKPLTQRPSHFNKRYKSPCERVGDSNHSLEVYNIDYDVRKVRQKRSSSSSENNFKQYDEMMKRILRAVEVLRKSKSFASTKTYSSRAT